MRPLLSASQQKKRFVCVAGAVVALVWVMAGDAGAQQNCLAVIQPGRACYSSPAFTLGPEQALEIHAVSTSDPQCSRFFDILVDLHSRPGRLAISPIHAAHLKQ
jgi:hypothetical protein